MHLVEPYYHWRNLYIASEDDCSPFYGREYSEFEFENRIYNYLIHPQWDEMGSETLFIKILYVDYEDHYAIIEMIGEWNDAIENDIKTLKEEILDLLYDMGVNEIILIGENVLNFHASDDCYYEACIDDFEDGWIALVNFHEHVESEMIDTGIDQFFVLGGKLDMLDWRTFLPHQLHNKVKHIIEKRLN